MTEFAKGPVPDSVPVSVTVATVVLEKAVIVAYLYVPLSLIVRTFPLSAEVPAKEAALIVIVTPEPLKAENDAVADDAGVLPRTNTPLLAKFPEQGSIIGIPDCAMMAPGDPGRASSAMACAAVNDIPGAVDPVLLP